MFVIGLTNDALEYITGIDGTYALLPVANNDDLLVYKLKKEPQTTFTRRMSTGELSRYSAVEKYWFNSTSGAFLALTKDTSRQKSIYSLQKTAFGATIKEDFWQGPPVDNLVFNSDGTQFAFTTVNDKGHRSLWYGYLDERKAQNLLTDTSAAIETGLKIAEISGISKGNKRIYLLLKNEKPRYIPGPGLDIYSYKDPKLQSQQLKEMKLDQPLVKAVVNIADGHFLRLEHQHEEVMQLNRAALPDKYVLLVKNGPGDCRNEWYWNKEAQASVYLLSLSDGSRKLLYNEISIDRTSFFYLSPDEKHVVFFDPKKSNYCSLEIATGHLINIKGKTQTTWTRKDMEEFPADKSSPFGVGGFTDDGKSALIYDQYDIYNVDLGAKTAPINITAFTGRKHHIVLRLLLQQVPLDTHETILLKAFNENNKDQGYYSMALTSFHGPDSLSMLPMSTRRDFIKAKNANAYLVMLEDASSSPNVFYSSDLRTFFPLSNIHPEQKYNWLTSELVNWRTPAGIKHQGVLYKPENFDPHKKYPLIFVYYEQKTDQLHHFDRPDYGSYEINIPFFVSNGYLVFTPDIHYTIGMPGRSAFNAIISAADLLSKRPYVDKTKMGLHGHSFGGFETNYIITHTTRFAAAMSSCGMTDFISAYGSIIGDGTSRQRQYEINRDRIGATPWKRPDLYIENSPVFRADLVRTPLLMMANIADWDVPYEQGVEFFTALRRLGRKAWMLQYDGMGHGVWGDAERDYTLRVFQFFNYYLKGDFPPKWMTTGIPAEQKGLDSGLQLDTSGTTP